jgi:hypothetical protein
VEEYLTIRLDDHRIGDVLIGDHRLSALLLESLYGLHRNAKPQNVLQLRLQIETDDAHLQGKQSYNDARVGSSLRGTSLFGSG